MLSRTTTSTVDRETWRGLTPLGVGLPYLPGIDPAIYRSGLIDYVEISADILCRPHRGERGMSLDPALVERARDDVGDLPIVVHGVELSIGSAGGWNDSYVTMLLAFQHVWPFQWHSEHLHFQTVSRPGEWGEEEIGVPLPLPFTEEAAALVADRARRLNRMFEVPFLLENSAHYLGQLPHDDGIAGEADFLNRIATDGDCGFLLDLHNLYCNQINNGDDAAALLDELRLDRVGEIHIAGGRWADGFRMDSHDGIAPEPVWALLERILPHCSRVGGLVFEIMPDHARALGCTAILEELGRLRAIWTRHRSRQGAEPCLT